MMKRVAFTLLLVVWAVGGASQYADHGTITVGEDPRASRGCALVGGGGGNGGSGSETISFILAQNGDTSTVTVTVHTPEASTITAATLAVESSVDWLADQTHGTTATSPAGTSHELTFPAGGIQLWDTDELVCSVTFGDASTIEVRQAINYTPAPVTVVHDGYIAGGFMQSTIDLLAPGEYGYSLPGQVETWQEFGESFDTYLIGQKVICEAEADAPQLLVDHILPHNADFVPDYFFYYGWVAQGTYQPATFGQLMKDAFLNSAFTLRTSTGVDVEMDWGPAIINPLGFTVTGQDTTWQFDVYAELVSDMISHSSNYVANTGILFDYAEEIQFPWWGGANSNRATWDLDNDGIPYDTDLYFSPGDPTEANRPWGDITEDQAYQITLRRCYTKLKELKPDVRFAWNGQYGSERSTTDSRDYNDFSMLERYRDQDSSTQDPGWLYVPTWESFLTACGSYADLFGASNGLPWNSIHWDSRENLTLPRVGTDRLIPIMTNLGEGAALLSNGIASFAYLDRDAPAPNRYAMSIDPVAASMNLGVPAGPIVVDGWGKAHREWTDGRIDIQWGGAMMQPVPYGWKVTDGIGTTIRTVGWDSFPSVDNASIICSYHALNWTSEPTWLDLEDISTLIALEHDYGYGYIRFDTPDVSYGEHSLMAVTNSPISSVDPLGNNRANFLYLGIDQVVYGQNILSATLTMEVGWSGMVMEAGDHLYICAVTDPAMGRWLNDPLNTTWDNPSPGEVWPSSPDTWTLDDFGTSTDYSTPTNLVAGDLITFDISGIAEYAAANPDDYYGIIMVLNLDSGSGGTQTMTFNAPEHHRMSYEVHADVVTGPSDTTPPGTPRNLLATAGDEAISLDWDDNAEPDLRDYTVYRAVGVGSMVVYQAGLLVSNFDDTGLVNGTEYSYRISATDDAGNESSMTATVTATPADVLPPLAPEGLIATAGDGSVSLDWDDNTEPDLDQYSVWRSEVSGGPYTAVSNPATSEYVDTGRTNGTEYFYVVVAHDEVPNNSTDSAEDSAVPTGVAGAISSWADLDAVRNDLAGEYTLMVDLDSSSPDYAGIGDNFDQLQSSYSPRFEGIFHGNGHTISDVVLNSSVMPGLFGGIRNCLIENLGLINATITGTSSSGTGLFIGEANSAAVVRNCYVSGGSVSGASKVGGFVGYNYAGTFENCYAVGVAVSGTGTDIGGFVGYQRSTITNCFADCSVSGSTNAGGFAGIVTGGTITNAAWNNRADNPGFAIGSTSGDVTYNISDNSAWFYDPTQDLYDTQAPVWDFTTPVWYAIPGDYPALSNQAAPPVTIPTSYNWTPPTTGTPVEYYVVQLETDGGGYVTIETVTDTTGTIDLEPGRTYSVRVAGVDADDAQGDWSDPSDEYTPEAP